jgi:hypothetical protein
MLNVEFGLCGFFFFIYYIKSFMKIPSFVMWKNPIKECVEIYGHP